MTQKEIESALIAELARITPDIDIEDVDRSHDLREEFDIDSIDFLNLVTALHGLWRGVPGNRSHNHAVASNRMSLMVVGTMCGPAE